MEFSYYDNHNQIKKLDIKIGSKWSEIKTDNVYLNSIFRSVDNGDDIAQEQEFSIVKFLLKKADSLLSKTAGDDVVDDDELFEMIKHFKDDYKMGELKNGRIDKIDLDDYTIDSLKKRYTGDKYKFKEDYYGITITDKNTNEVVLNVFREHDYNQPDKDVIVINENPNSKDRISRSYGQDGIIVFYDGIDGKRHQPIAEDFEELLNSKESEYSKTDLLKKVGSMLEKINSQNIEFIFDRFSQNTEKYLDEVIKSSPLLKNNHYIREKILNHLNRCLEEYFDYRHDFKNENSQVINKFHTGDVYTVDCKNEKMTITNTRTSKQRTLDLNELVKNIPQFFQVEVKKYLSELPGEFLMDLSIETDSFKNGQLTNIENMIMNISKDWSGFYSPTSDTITLGGYDKEDEKFSGLKGAWSEVIVHELGHALDNFNDKYLSNKCDEFKEAYKNGIDAFIKAGYVTCTDSNNYDPYGYVRPEGTVCTGGISPTSNYATANYQEMFAECYTYLMTGSCASASMLEDFFPDCLRIANEMIEQVRALPDEVRH